MAAVAVTFWCAAEASGLLCLESPKQCGAQTLPEGDVDCGRVVGCGGSSSPFCQANTPQGHCKVAGWTPVSVDSLGTGGQKISDDDGYTRIQRNKDCKCPSKDLDLSVPLLGSLSVLIGLPKCAALTYDAGELFFKSSSTLGLTCTAEMTSSKYCPEGFKFSLSTSFFMVWAPETCYTEAEEACPAGKTCLAVWTRKSECIWYELAPCPSTTGTCSDQRAVCLGATAAPTA
eukprot:Hpha_TRINITY_DN25091_c0_g1::TRINITY_DN25091_c0_g1_i1::g.109785::m.109785